MTTPSTYSVQIGDNELVLPVVRLTTAPISIALFDSLGDWPLCDFLAKALIKKAHALATPLSGIDVVLTAGKAVTLAESVARALDIKEIAVAEKKAKSFWQDSFGVPSRSITGAEPEQLVIGGRRADMLRNRSILILDDVISTGESIHALIKIAQHFGRASLIMSAFVEGDDAVLPTDLEKVPVVTLSHLPVFPAS